MGRRASSQLQVRAAGRQAQAEEVHSFLHGHGQPASDELHEVPFAFPAQSSQGGLALVRALASFYARLPPAAPASVTVPRPLSLLPNWSGGGGVTRRDALEHYRIALSRRAE